MEPQEYIGKWLLMQYKTADDQYLRDEMLRLVGVRRTDSFDESFKWMLVKALPHDEYYWVFSQRAGGNPLQLASVPVLGRQFTTYYGFDRTNPLHVLELKPRNDGSYSIVVRDSERLTLSTRWNSPAFPWGFKECDDQQKIRLREGGRFAVPSLVDPEPDLMAEDFKHLRIDAFDKEPIKETPPRVVGSELIAFPFVREQEMTFQDQFSRSPYYLLKRESLWRRTGWWTYEVGQETEREDEIFVGITSTSEHSVEKTLDVRIGSKAEFSIAGATVGMNMSWRKGGTLKHVESVNRQVNEKSRVTVKFKPGDKGATALYNRVNVYSVARTDGTVISQLEYVERHEYHQRSWPFEAMATLWV